MSMRLHERAPPRVLGWHVVRRGPTHSDGRLPAVSCARFRRYAADKLTELVTAALDAGADAGTLAGLQVAAPPHAPLMRCACLWRAASGKLAGTGLHCWGCLR